MRASTNLSLLLATAGTQVFAQETGQLGDAAQVVDNPVGVVYTATLPESAFFKPAYPDGGNIKGEISAVANPDGLGVQFTLKLSNLPKTGGPFPYHLHVAPVPENGNCTATLAHLDPYIRGEATPCDASAPETCQVGDLSGKHGSIPADTDTYETSYVDLYASTVDGLGAFFGNRSIVFHYPNKTRISCANFELTAGEPVELPSSSSTEGSFAPTSATTMPTGASTLAPNMTATTTGAGPAATTTGVVIGAAAGLRVGVAGLAVVGAAALFML